MASSPLSYIGNLTRYANKTGGIYKASGTMSITPATSITSDGTNGILGTVRWTNTDYAAIVTAFGFQITTTTGFASAGPMGISVYRATGYTAVDTGGTDVTSSFGAKLLTGMPSSRAANIVMCQNATSAMTAGTRTLGNPIYTTTAIAQTGASTIQAGTIWQLRWNEDEPLILLANEGFEYQIPTGLTLAQNKNLTVNMITTWMEVPREVITDRYGI